MYYNRSRSSVEDQGHCSMKTSFNRQIIVLFYEIVVAESNGNVRILIWSWKIAVYAHAQYKIDQNSQERLAQCSGGLKLQCISNCHIFVNYFINFIFILARL